VIPRDAAWTNVRSKFDEAFASKSVHVELQAILQTNTLGRAIIRLFHEPKRSLRRASVKDPACAR
jgi:hypothetical protein